MITRQEIEALFQVHLDRMEDEELRGKVVDVWVEGCKLGSWDTMEALKALPFTLLTETHGVSFIEHTLAVTAGAIGLAEAQLQHYESMPYEVNMDYVIAGGLLHDVGKLMESEPDGKGNFVKSHAGRCARHPISGAILADRFGICQEVLNIIICHAKEGDGRPQRLEAVLVHQADFATFNPLVMMNKGDLIMEGEA